MDKTHEEKLYENIDGPGGYEIEDPWRYRFLGPHGLAAGLVVQHLREGQNRVLELGSAEGLLSMRVCETSRAMQVAGSDVPTMRHVHEYVGLELSAKAVEVARRRAADTVWKTILRYEQADISDERLWPEGEFDVVVLSEVIPYLPALVRESYAHHVFHRLVREGGHLVLLSWMTSECGRSYSGDWPIHQVRSDGRLLYTKPDHDGGSGSPYVERWVVVQKKGLDWPWASLW